MYNSPLEVPVIDFTLSTILRKLYSSDFHYWSIVTTYSVEWIVNDLVSVIDPINILFVDIALISPIDLFD